MGSYCLAGTEFQFCKTEGVSWFLSVFKAIKKEDWGIWEHFGCWKSIQGKSQWGKRKKGVRICDSATERIVKATVCEEGQNRT